MANSKEINEIIENGGLNFSSFSRNNNGKDEKVKTKAKKKQYITGSHGSASAKQKAKYRAKRINKSKRR